MGRLTADLIKESRRFRNDHGEHVLDLKGKRIYLIESLDATEDQFDTIDLSHNELVKIDNFPKLNRLGTLLLDINGLKVINPNIGEFLPELHTLVLANNPFDNFVEINPLASLPKLQHLTLVGNNITTKPCYRLYIIHKFKSLISLDSNKIEEKERIEASKVFSSKEAEKMYEKSSLMPSLSPTPEDFAAAESRIRNSKTPREAARHKKTLKAFQDHAATIVQKRTGMNIYPTDVDREGPTGMEQPVKDEIMKKAKQTKKRKAEDAPGATATTSGSSTAVETSSSQNLLERQRTARRMKRMEKVV